MSELFRFMVLRPAAQVDADKTIVIGGAGESQLAADLKKAAGSASPQDQMRQIAHAFVAKSPNFIDSSESLAFGKGLNQIVDDLQRPKTKGGPDSLTAIAQSAFANPSHAVEDERFLHDKRRIHDSII